MTQAYNLDDLNVLQSDCSTWPNKTISGTITLRDLEKSHIMATLKEQNYNRTRSARILGIGIRTLQRKIKIYREEACEAEIFELNPM